MSKIKNGGLHQHGAEPYPNSNNLEQLALKGLNINSVASLFTPPTWTRQNPLVLSAVVFTPPTRQDKPVLSRPCEQANSCKLETGSRRGKTVFSTA